LRITALSPAQSGENEQATLNLSLDMSTSQPATHPSSTATCSLLLVDDHPALRAGLRSLLSGTPGMLIQADVASGEEAYAWYRVHQPDVVVMDLSMEGYGGIEALRRIIQFDPQARILIFTVHDSDVMLYRALDMGALGYVTKASDVDILISGIREVARHRGFISPDMIPAMVRRHTVHNRSLLDQLGEREFQILLLTSQGHKAGECAQMLNLSEKTVRNHLTRIKARLNVADTAELTRLAIRAGLVEP
jgi:two-component system, NarL family, invasion response regulator UvrY